LTGIAVAFGLEEYVTAELLRDSKKPDFGLCPREVHFVTSHSYGHFERLYSA